MRILLAVGMLMLPAVPLVAQTSGHAIPGPQASMLWAVSAPADTDSVKIHRGSHWQTGALVGGLAGGAFGFAVMRSVCALAETDASCEAGNTILGSLMFGAAGAAVGAIIGGLFPRH